MDLITTPYYDEFLRYYKMCKWQHDHCNLGTTPHGETIFDDDLIKNVLLYDVAERKYAGFTQLILDMWYPIEDHPYRLKLPEWRKKLIHSFDIFRVNAALEEWLYVFFIHRLCGSAINYAQMPAGYWHSPLYDFASCAGVGGMVNKLRTLGHKPIYTSIGYQIAPFPKAVGEYRRGGDYFMCEHLPDLCAKFRDFLLVKPPHTFKKCMNFLRDYNRSLDCRVFWFQYGAVLADVADFFPQYVDGWSPFFQGKNAIECLSYMAKKPTGVSQQDYMDMLVEKLVNETGAKPYNLEDIACDFIRWIESYINGSEFYKNLDLDKVFSSHQIKDHPFGRQKAMLDLKLVKTFNGKSHPSDNTVLLDNDLSEDQYKTLVEVCL